MGGGGVNGFSSNSKNKVKKYLVLFETDEDGIINK